jgi:hypothetical protein
MAKVKPTPSGTKAATAAESSRRATLRGDQAARLKTW